MEDVMALASLDPELEKIMEQSGPPPELYGDINHIRAVLSAGKKSLAGNDTLEGIIEEDITVPARDGYEIPVRLHKPAQSPAGGSPLLVVYHGGGFCLGNLDSEAWLCRKVAQTLGVVCFNVDYRLAPEHPFPAAPHDAWDALKWVTANASKIGADPLKGFLVGGTSAGGGLTDVVAHLARDEKLSPPLTGLLEMIPVVLPPTVVPLKYQAQYLSREQCKFAPILSEKAIKFFDGHYKADPHSILAAPFNHPDGHAGLPPVYFMVSGMDPLRDEALIYEQVLREDYGIMTKLKMYPGTPHGFYNFFPSTNLAKKYQKDAVDGVEWLLAQKETIIVQS